MANLRVGDYIYPVSTYLKITQIYHSAHLGIDLGWWDGYSNQEIVAIADGTVIDVVDGWGNTYPNRRIYGNYVIVDHGNGVYSLYGHLLTGTKTYVTKGQQVKQGQPVGRMGNSGYSNGQHLHFELRNGGNAKKYSTDPVPYLVVKNRDIWINKTSKEYDKIIKQYSPVEPSQRDESKDQLDIKINTLRCRTRPTLKAENLGLLTSGYYNVYASDEAEGFTWYKIGDDRWCAKVNGVEFIPGDQTHLYKVIYPAVSAGDVKKLETVAEEMAVEIIIEDAKEIA